MEKYEGGGEQKNTKATKSTRKNVEKKTDEKKQGEKRNQSETHDPIFKLGGKSRKNRGKEKTNNMLKKR